MDWYLTDFPSSHSASRVPTSSHHFRPIPTPLVPFWFCMPTSASFTPDAMQFAPCQYTLPPFGPRRLPFSAAFFFHPFPFAFPTSLKIVIFPPLNQLLSFLLLTNKTLPQKQFHIFLRNQARNTRNATQASSAWIIYVSIPPLPGGIYFAQAKEGYRVCG